MRLLLALCVVWEVVGRAVLGGRAAAFVPLPSGVVAAAWELARSGELFVHLAHSAARVAVGGGVGAVAGVLAGAAMAARGGRVLEAPLALLRPIPPLAWIPLTLLWFGVGELQQLAILAGASFHLVAAGTADAVRRVPPALDDAAANLGAGWALRAQVRTRAALPGVLTAVTEGFATAWLVVVAAEFVSATDGLGVLVLEGRDLLLPARTFVGMAALAGAGAVTAAALGRARARLTRWA